MKLILLSLCFCNYSVAILKKVRVSNSNGQEDLLGVRVIKEKKSESLILASKSSARATLLKNAGISFETAPSSVDEDPIKRTMKSKCSEAVAK